MREIVFDTETTGLEPGEGDRVVEIGCLELINHMPSGRTYHTYINPERDMPSGAFNVHGLSEEFLSDKPLFSEIADDFLAFIEGATLIAHNARFDIGFINAELKRIKRPELGYENVIDTMKLARNKFPGAPSVSLDALCKRFEIDNTARTLHGALLDSELLAEVYLELIGGRQPGLELAAERKQAAAVADLDARIRPPRPHQPSEVELAAHRAFIETQVKDSLWLKRERGAGESS